MTPLQTQASAAAEEARRRSVAAFKIEYPPELPISENAERIREIWREHGVIIVAGDTGSGKTTQLPKIALELGCGVKGMIGCTQPRRIAAATVAERVADELRAVRGQGAGYQVRFDDRTAPGTAIKFMTDGILLAETLCDRDLRRYDALIIDEAHERSLNIDFLLGYLKNLRVRRPELKIAVSSATIDTETFSAFFGHAPCVNISGRTFPVDDLYLPPERDEELADTVMRGVEEASALNPRGDILVFLPGEREIRECRDLLLGRSLPRTEVLMLFGRLAESETRKVFQPCRSRKIILATNAAETSITVPGIRFVIDSGLARIKRFNPRSRIEELRIEPVSRASIRQRRGRCGRVADGICIHLYGKEDEDNAPRFTDPEILRSALAGVILRMAALNLPPVDRFPLINPPSPGAVREGLATLRDLEALDSGGGLTAEGRKMAKLPADPHIAKMLCRAVKYQVREEMTVIAAALSMQEVFERPAEKKQAADEAHRRFRHPDSDFLTLLNVWKAVTAEGMTGSRLRKFCADNYLNCRRVREWRNLAADFRESLAKIYPDNHPAAEPGGDPPYDMLHQAVLAGVPRNISCLLPEEQVYAAAGNRKFTVFPGSALARRKPKPKWMLSFALVETSRLFGRVNAEIRPEYFERAAGRLCSRVYDRVHYEPASGYVYAREKLLFGGLIINPGRKKLYSEINPAEAREVFIREALAEGKPAIRGTWTEKAALHIKALRDLEIKIRRPGALFSPAEAERHYLKVLPDTVCSDKTLEKLCREDRTDYGARQTADDAEADKYPDRLLFSGTEFRLRYTFEPGEPEDGIVLLCPEKKLNLLPYWAPEYLVPGFLREKTLLLLKTLGKEKRRALLPLQDTAADFCAALELGTVFRERPFTEALTDFIGAEYGIPADADEFDPQRLPEYLKMKIGVTGDNGKITELITELPDRGDSGSKIHSAGMVIPYSRSVPGTEFPPGKIEDEIILKGGTPAYPALCAGADGRVETAVYLDREEAEVRHRRGITALFRAGRADQIKFLQRGIRMTNRMKLSWGMNYPEFAEDMLDLAVTAALPLPAEKIRAREDFLAAAETAAQNLGEALDGAAGKLAALDEIYHAVNALLKRNRYERNGAEDQIRHLDFLFRPGFLKYKAVFRDYAKFLRGAKLRAERAVASPGSDERKYGTLAEYPDKLYAAAAAVDDITLHPHLENFWRLTEEARLAVFAPEIGTTVKNPVKKLPDAWKELKI